ncbi:MAG: pyridoxamine 5'-phosphate oxidase family protein [Oscillospiraceae bacterium]|nr:pyridoxamine 5'-phosphate oxidase family protein [Oscillospiraceae bacterium]MDY3066064.1 pyridoxamine 5'-phosphate oxidase family protein [Oscillospiraceae bacterium]
MRRQDREIVDPAQICGILKRSKVCFLSLCDGNTPYTVPMNFGFTEEAGRITLYLHSARSGRKLELIRKNPNVCAAFGTMLSFEDGETGCKATAQYESAVGFGTAEILSDLKACEKGLSCLLSQYESRAAHDFSVLLDRTAVIRVVLDRITGKTNRKETV